MVRHSTHGVLMHILHIPHHPISSHMTGSDILLINTTTSCTAYRMVSIAVAVHRCTPYYVLFGIMHLYMVLQYLTTHHHIVVLMAWHHIPTYPFIPYIAYIRGYGI